MVCSSPAINVLHLQKILIEQMNTGEMIVCAELFVHFIIGRKLSVEVLVLFGFSICETEQKCQGEKFMHSY